MNTRDVQAIPDVQATPDSRKLAIDKVGIKAIRHPMQIKERSGAVQHTIASFNMYVGLPDRFIDHGDPGRLLASVGLDAEGIQKSITNVMSE